MRYLHGLTNSVDMNLSKLRETEEEEEPGVLQSMGSQRVGHDVVTEEEEEVGEWRKHQGLLS